LKIKNYKKITEKFLVQLEYEKLNEILKKRGIIKNGRRFVSNN